jgi:uncharacterized protein DUF3500
MKRLLSLAVAVVFYVPTFIQAQQQSSTEAVVPAANDFLATLTAEQKQKVMYAFDDATQRARWSNFPTGVVARGGISLKQMSAEQQEAAMKLMGTVLSPMGLEKVNEIRQADDDFKANGSKRGPGGGGPRPQGPPPGVGQGGPPPQFGGRGSGGPGGRPPSGGNLFGSDLYFISFLGMPSATQPWMLQFGGHHLALNITIVGSRGVLTPTLTGAQPALFKLNGKIIRPVGRESDKALALLKSLDEAQQKQAVLNYQVADLVLGPGLDGKKISPEGLKASKMNTKQKTMLLDLIAEWSGFLTEPYASARLSQMKADLDDTYFAWSGATSAEAGTNITAYYRIQGPHLVIEYAPQSDEPGNHVHTMYRDPTNDYGSAFAKQ